MTLKLNKILFEEQDSKEIHRLLKEAEGDQDEQEKSSGEKDEQDNEDIDLDNIKFLSTPDLKLISKQIADKIYSSLKVKGEKEIYLYSKDEENKKNPLGLISSNAIKNIHKIPVKGYILNPMQLQGDQKEGADASDIKFYEKLQIIPVMLNQLDKDKEMSSTGTSSKGKSYVAIFLIPAIGAEIVGKQNVDLHKSLFNLPDTGEEPLVHVSLNNLLSQQIGQEEIEQIQAAFKSNKPQNLKKFQKLQAQRKPQGKPKSESNFMDIYKNNSRKKVIQEKFVYKEGIKRILSENENKKPDELSAKYLDDLDPSKIITFNSRYIYYNDQWGGFNYVYDDTNKSTILMHNTAEKVLAKIKKLNNNSLSDFEEKDMSDDVSSILENAEALMRYFGASKLGFKKPKTGNALFYCASKNQNELSYNIILRSKNSNSFKKVSLSINKSSLETEKQKDAIGGLISSLDKINLSSIQRLQKDFGGGLEAKNIDFSKIENINISVEENENIEELLSADSKTSNKLLKGAHSRLEKDSVILKAVLTQIKKITSQSKESQSQEPESTENQTDAKETEQETSSSEEKAKAKEEERAEEPKAKEEKTTEGEPSEEESNEEESEEVEAEKPDFKPTPEKVEEQKQTLVKKYNEIEEIAKDYNLDELKAEIKNETPKLDIKLLTFDSQVPEQGDFKHKIMYIKVNGDIYKIGEDQASESRDKTFTLEITSVEKESKRLDKLLSTGSYLINNTKNASSEEIKNALSSIDQKLKEDENFFESSKKTQEEEEAKDQEKAKEEEEAKDQEKAKDQEEDKEASKEDKSDKEKSSESNEEESEKAESQKEKEKDQEEQSEEEKIKEDQKNRISKLFSADSNTISGQIKSQIEDAFEDSSTSKVNIENIIDDYKDYIISTFDNHFEKNKSSLDKFIKNNVAPKDLYKALFDMLDVDKLEIFSESYINNQFSLIEAYNLDEDVSPFTQILNKAKRKYKASKNFNIIKSILVDYIFGKQKDSSKEVKNLSSSVLVSKIKGKLSDDELKSGITVDHIKSVVVGEISKVLLSAIKIANPETYETMGNIADRNILEKKREETGFAGVPFIGNWLNSLRSDDSLAKRLTGTEVAEGRSNYLNDQVKEDAEIVFQILLSLVQNASSKSVLENKNLFVGSITELLFENLNEEKNQKSKISAEEIRKQLNGSGISIYKEDKTSNSFKKAEAGLIRAIADMLDSNFDIEVEGVEKFEALNIQEDVVESEINKNAEKGQPASESVSQMFGQYGLPTGMNDAFNLNQMAYMVNMMGGNPMMMFTMMMMNQQLMQQMMMMQKKGASFEDASKVIAEKEPNLENFEEDLNKTIESERKKLPVIRASDAIKLFDAQKQSNFNSMMSGEVKFYKQFKSSEEFLEKLKIYFEITEKNSKSFKINEKSIKSLVKFITRQILDCEKIAFKDKNNLGGRHVFAYMYTVYLETLFGVKPILSKKRRKDAIKKIKNISLKEELPVKIIKQYFHEDADIVAVLKKIGVIDSDETEAEDTKATESNETLFRKHMNLLFEQDKESTFDSDKESSSDEDQQSSDEDQQSSDEDQQSSDEDQQSSDEDQQSSDESKEVRITLNEIQKQKLISLLEKSFKEAEKIAKQFAQKQKSVNELAFLNKDSLVLESEFVKNELKRIWKI